MNYLYPCKPNWLAPDSSFFAALDNDDRWVAEVKKNGWRCLVYRENDSVILYTRHRTVINEKLPRLRDYLRVAVPPGTILDCELIHSRTKTVKEFLYPFDLLTLSREPLVERPLEYRRALLEKYISPSPGLFEIARQFTTDKVALYERVIAGDPDVDEGIVLKKLSSKYLPSPTRCLQHPQWFKVKRLPPHLFQN